MDIGRTDGVGGAGRIDGPQRTHRTPPAAYTNATGPADRVDISAQAHMISETLGLPAIRMERVEEVRQLIESGRFDTPDRLEKALDRFLAEER